MAAATQAALDNASRAAGGQPVAALPAVAAELDVLIGRLRGVLESLPAGRPDREG